MLLTAPAFARSWHITHFDARCTVAEDGTVLVEEEIHPLFQGAYNGILRDIPVEYPGPDGTNYRLLVKVASVTDENGSPIKFEQSSRNQRVAGGAVHQFLVLKIYAAGTDTERTVHITYRVQNAIRYFKDFDEFYWNVTGLDCAGSHRRCHGHGCAARHGRRPVAGQGLHRHLRLTRRRRHGHHGRRQRQL